MKDTLSMLTGLLGGYGGKSTSSVTDAMRQSDPQYYGQKGVVTHWDDGTTTMDGFAQNRRKKQGQTSWDMKTSADDALSGMRQFPEDSLVAHIAPWEADLLSLLGGSGSVNKNTGLLQFGWGGGDGDNDADSDTNGVDNGGDQGDRGMDAGSLGGDDRGGTGSDSDDSDYSGHGYSSGRGGGDGSGRSGGSSGGFGSLGEGGVLGNKFRDAYAAAPAIRAQGLTTAETMDSMSPSQRATYAANVEGLNDSPFSAFGGDMQRDTTPASRAGSMFSDAKMRQLTDNINLGGVINQGLMSAGYNTSPPTDVLSKATMAPEDDTYSRYFNTDWGRFNQTAFPGSSPQNAMSNQAFADYVSNSPVAAKALGIMRDMELAGKDISGMGITSGNQGKHAQNSRHYSNAAVDVNTKGNQNSFANFSNAMENAGYSRGDKLGWGAKERHHFQ